jgi:hypothetical protein
MPHWKSYCFNLPNTWWIETWWIELLKTQRDGKLWQHYNGAFVSSMPYQFLGISTYETPFCCWIFVPKVLETASAGDVDRMQPIEQRFS